MANMLADAMSALGDAMDSSMSEEVEISNGKFTTTGVSAVIGRTRAEQVFDGQGSTVQNSTTDFLIAKSVYTLNDEEVEPQLNHTITRANGQKYRVTPVIPDEPPWRWMSDVSRDRYRIHVREIAN